MRLATYNGWLVVVVVLCAALHSAVQAGPLSPNSFRAKAKLNVDERALSLSYAVALREAIPAAPGYSWLRISLFSYAPTPEDIAEIMKGSAKSMDKRRYSKELYDTYNTSVGGLQLTLDENRHVTQVNMNVPGNTCTVVASEEDLAVFSKRFHFDGKQLKLVAKGSFDCGTISQGSKLSHYVWDVNLNVPVFEKTPN